MMYYCANCGYETADPDRNEHDDGITLNVFGYICPKCGSMQIERMKECECCHGGWRRLGDFACGKCKLRLTGDIQRFARDHTPAECNAMDNLMEGTGLVMFR